MRTTFCGAQSSVFLTPALTSLHSAVIKKRNERTLSVLGPDSMLGTEGGRHADILCNLALSLRDGSVTGMEYPRTAQGRDPSPCGSVARHAGIGGHGDVRMERAMDLGHSEEGATHGTSGLSYHSIVATGLQRGRRSSPAVP